MRHCSAFATGITAPFGIQFKILKLWWHLPLYPAMSIGGVSALAGKIASPLHYSQFHLPSPQLALWWNQHMRGGRGTHAYHILSVALFAVLLILLKAEDSHITCHLWLIYATFFSVRKFYTILCQYDLRQPRQNFLTLDYSLKNHPGLKSFIAVAECLIGINLYKITRSEKNDINKSLKTGYVWVFCLKLVGQQ